jgi:hypothetical protein
MDNIESKEINIYRNKPQMLCLAVNPHILVVEAGRRTGKSEGIIAPRLQDGWISMPQSTGYIAGASFRKLLDHLLPGIISGLKMLKLEQDRDFVIAKPPPKSWPKPFNAPLKYDYFISTRWGSGDHLISFDSSVTSNGLTTDRGIIDEAKQLNPDRVRAELFKTMSGHQSIKISKHVSWGDLPQHRALTLTSDKYIGKRDFKWLDHYKKESASPEDIIRTILLLDQMQKQTNERVKYVLSRELMALRKNMTMYLEANTSENIAVLGIDYFLDAFKNSKIAEFKSSILNLDGEAIEGCFYSNLEKSIHLLVNSSHTSTIEAIGVNDYINNNSKHNNCLLDKDHKKELPIKLLVDYGSTYSWVVVTQFYNNTYWVLNKFRCEPDEVLTDMIEKVINYYRFNERKHFELYDDPLGHQTKKATNTSDSQDIQKYIRINKWTVEHKTPSNKYISHADKYRMMRFILDERSNRNNVYPRLRISNDNAYEVYYSMASSPAKKIGNDEYRKDKSSEGDITIDQWKATHLGDCLDQICWDVLSIYNSNQDKFAF